MKKVTKPEEPEEAVYYSDFTGKLLQGSNEFGPPITIQINFDYGSEHDGSKLEIHLEDKDFDRLNAFLRYEATKEFLDYLKKELKF